MVRFPELKRSAEVCKFIHLGVFKLFYSDVLKNIRIEIEHALAYILANWYGGAGLQEHYTLLRYNCRRGTKERYA